MMKYPYQRNGCNCASPCDQYHGWECSITDGECMYLYPDAITCAKRFGEGPLAELVPQETDGTGREVRQNGICSPDQGQ